MPKEFVIADTHFGHNNILGFKDECTGELIRKFNDIEHHDTTIINNWNSVVSPEDTVYVLGDVAINRRHVSTIARCKGRKILVKGNHDVFKLKEYLPYFEDIRACKIFSKHGLILTHIPIHPQCMDRWKVNVHGHLHTDIILERDTFEVDDSYMCVSCEQINFTPVEIKDLLLRNKSIG